MASVQWDHSKFVKSTEGRAMDGLEEWARGPCLTRCKEECPVAPVNGGTMRSSLGVERDDKCVYIGGGGAAKDYIFRQHQDRSFHHTTGKAKFITDPVQALSKDIPKYIEKHVK